jgi:hypothetical protein
MGYGDGAVDPRNVASGPANLSPETDGVVDVE